MTVEEFHNYMIRGGIILKNCDALRYFCVTRTLGAELPEQPQEEDLISGGAADYDDVMTGGDMDPGYLCYG